MNVPGPAEAAAGVRNARTNPQTWFDGRKDTAVGSWAGGALNSCAVVRFVTCLRAFLLRLDSSIS